jgi:hypothetical protein
VTGVTNKILLLGTFFCNKINHLIKNVTNVTSFL